MKELVIFADESGTSGDTACYAIGAVTIPKGLLDDFNRAFTKLKKRHGVEHEVKWSRIRTSHGAINFVLDWLKLIFMSDVSYDAIVVNKKLYRNWNTAGADKERPFYQTYVQLLRHRARQSDAGYEVYIDDRSDAYARQDEVVTSITNSMLAQIKSRARITVLKKTDSHLMPGIQVADVLTGAITAGHRLHLERGFTLSGGKRLLIKRLAGILGWDELCYDTWPNPKFNVWHFPIEYRAEPATRRIKPTRVPYVTGKDLGDA